MMKPTSSFTRCVKNILILSESTTKHYESIAETENVLEGLYCVSLQLIIVYKLQSSNEKELALFIKNTTTWKSTREYLHNLRKNANWSPIIPNQSTIWDAHLWENENIMFKQEHWNSFISSLIGCSWDVFELGYYHQEIMRVVQKKSSSKSYIAGVFYTPIEVIEEVITTLLQTVPTSPSLLAKKLCDPACGCGFFLLVFINQLKTDGLISSRQIADFVHHNVFGIDIDPIAVEITQYSLYFLVDSQFRNLNNIRSNIQCANTLFSDDALCTQPYIPKHQFDIIIGNPPWISYSGKHAEPIPKAVKRYYREKFQSAQGWISLAALFIERSLELLSDSGTLALLVPVQLCDLAGYSAFREFVLCSSIPIEPFILFPASVFGDISTPSVAMILKKRKASSMQTRILEITHRQTTRQIEVLEKLNRLSKPPPEIFIDCGVHTGNCASKLILHAPISKNSKPIYEGKNLFGSGLEPPKLWLNCSYSKQKNEYFNIRPLDTYHSCKILIRQTASKPIACLHNPKHYFRNSILGCIGLPNIPDKILLYWLHSTLVEWFHMMTIRESTQKSFPQIKIAHLRNLPLPHIEEHHITEMKKMKGTNSIDEYLSSLAGLTAEEHQYMRNEVQKK